MYRVSFQAPTTHDQFRVRLSGLRQSQASPVPTTMEPSPELIEGGIYVSLTAIKTSSDVMLKEKKFKWQIAVATSGQMAFLYGVAPCGELANLDKISKWSMTNSGGVDIFTLPGLCVMYKIGSLPHTMPTKAGFARMQTMLSKCRIHERPCPVTKAPIRLGVDWTWVKNSIASLASQGYIPHANAAVHYWSEPCVKLALANWAASAEGVSGRHKTFDESA